ncbi:MAG: ribonuclease HII [Candidatus Aminicenantes bacterium]|nr:ribonuclease HII [Candidatus Aminicenantes bacterium]
MPDFSIEREAVRFGYNKIAGVDEVGRGALFGPVTAAAVIFPESTISGKTPAWMDEINDSKLLSPKKRERLAEAIFLSAYSVGIGFASNSEIDQRNIYFASLDAMSRAVKNCCRQPDFLLVDGFNLNSVHYKQKRIPKGDRKSLSIAAASIVAKVIRDDLICRMDPVFKGYCLSKNKGYGTKDHFKGLKDLGVTALHRKSFNLHG